MARRRFNTRGTAPKRLMIWIGINIAPVTFAAGGGSALVGTLSAAALLLRPFTVIRSRGKFMVHTDNAAAGENQVGVFSNQVVTQAATSGGIAGIPTPLTEFEADYFVYEPFFSITSLQTTSVVSGNGQITYEFDSKAMRKVDIDDDLAAVVQSDAASDGFIFQLNGRLLLKLH